MKSSIAPHYPPHGQWFHKFLAMPSTLYRCYTGFVPFTETAMIALTSDNYISPEEYLEMERHSPIKHEYMDGEIYAMAGTTKAHNIISLNLAFLLRNGLKDSGCRTFMADIKVNLSNQRHYFYPDLVVTCNDSDDLNAYTIEFPTGIIEVLSESTESFDRGKKFQYYRTIPSFQDYTALCITDWYYQSPSPHLGEGFGVRALYQIDEQTAVSSLVPRNI